MWMDHRASKEAEIINSKKHRLSNIDVTHSNVYIVYYYESSYELSNNITHCSVLQYLGNKISLEMQIPKLLWLKKNLPDTWKKAGYFFDLPDFLTMMASGSVNR